MTAEVSSPDARLKAFRSGRLGSLDAYRGFSMLLMASGGLGIAKVAESFPGSSLWSAIGYQFEHVEWTGCALWDLIQPSFMFMVGVSMPFSYAARAARGQSYGRMLLHALRRSLALVALGVFLRSNHAEQTRFTFEDVLSQIGLGYTFLFLLWGRGARVQLAAAAAILFADWLAFAVYPLPPSGFDHASVGVPPDWPRLTGLAAHFDKNTNLGTAFDQWFLNLFPREKPFAYNGGGYQTLNFVPSLATMVFGLLAGELLRGPRRPAGKVLVLLGASALGFVAGAALDLLGLCPIAKRIWTPAWALFSSGWTFLFLAGFYALMDVAGLRRWAFPLTVVGMNSIAVYCMAGLTGGWIARTWKIHLGPQVFQLSGAVYEPIVQSSAVLLCFWLVALWMLRRGIFLRI
ncbi:MAG: DUF5009 domain-containing protein [Planctomycetes bacterium]|nr:DUF5009 domain-containing protein [Planctomycetota bacterium]